MIKFESTFVIDHAHPALPGHFPGAPVVPGVAVLDRVLDVLALQAGIEPQRMELPQVKFIEPLLPGQVARIELEVDTDRARFRVHREQTLIASGQLHWPNAL
jgi:3-hydroxyacyl-[acyl-carrier-protein] dehydratase